MNDAAACGRRVALAACIGAVLALAAVGGPSPRAQEPPSPAERPAPAEPAEPPATQAEPRTAPAPDPAVPKGTRSDDTFRPTEEVEPENGVPFPTDI
jgi:hypothetical protein